jgi:Uma2 family endonuclease
VDVLNELLMPAVAGLARVRVQNPIALDSQSEPQPDIVLARKPWAGYPVSHPGPADIFLLIEVADSSRDFDLGAKRELYAKAGIQEFWVVDLTNDVVCMFRNPAGGAYARVTEVKPTGTLDIAALPGLTIEAATLFA